MLNWLDALRGKPRHVRTRTAFVVALLVTAVIAMLWSFTVPARFADIRNTSGVPEETQDDLNELGNLLESTRSSIQDTVDSAGNIPVEKEGDAPRLDVGGTAEEEAPTSSDDSPQTLEIAPRPVIIETTKKEEISE